MDNYTFHYFPISSFDTGTRTLSRVGVSSNVEKEICVYDFNKSSEEHDGSYKIINGHKAIITRLKLGNNCIVSGGLDGDLKLSYFGLFNSELKK